MIAYKDWKNLNANRSFPFREPLPGIPDSIIVGANLLVPNTFILPLLVSKVTITNSLFSLYITDSLGTYAGVFTYLTGDSCHLKPASFGCSGKIVVTGMVENAEPIIYATNIPLELAVTKLYKPGNINSLTITRKYAEDSIVKGDIVLEETLFSNISVLDTSTTTSEVTIGSTQSFSPKCNFQTPIQSINSVEPNTEGTIFLSPSNRTITIDKTGDNLMQVSSPFTIKDFDKRAYTASIGEPGPSGDPGRNGASGQLIPAPQPPGVPIVDYGGLQYNGHSLVTINTDGIIVDYVNDTHVATVTGKSLFILDTIDDREVVINDILCMGTVGDTFIVGGRGGLLKRYSKDGDFIEDLPSIGSEDIWHITAKNFYEFYISTANSILYYDSVSFHDYPIPDGTIRNIKVSILDDTPFVLYNDNKFYYHGSHIYYPTGREFNDVYYYDKDGEIIAWIIGQQGLLLKTNRTSGSIINQSNLIRTDLDLSAIHGTGSDYIVAVGKAGSIYIYNGRAWGRLASPTIKNWRSVRALTKYNTYIFGGYGSV